MTTEGRNSCEDQTWVEVTVVVTVCVDRTDDTIQSAILESGGLFSADQVVRDEIQSNLESVSYVRQVSIT